MSKSENVALYKYLTRPAGGRKDGRGGPIRIAPTESQNKEALKKFGKPFNELDALRRSRIRTGYYSDQEIGSWKKAPVTKMQEKIAQTIYGQPFDELTKDRKTRIRTGKTTLKRGRNPVNLMSTQERVQYTKNRAVDFVKNFENERGRKPSLTEMRKLGKFDYQTIKNFTNEGIIDIQKLGESRGLKNPQTPIIDSDLKILDNNKYIQDSFSRGEVPNIREVEKILKTKDRATVGYRVAQLASTYLGDRKVEGIKPKFKKGAELILENSENIYGPATRRLAELRIGKSVGERSTATTRNKIKYHTPEGFSDTYAIDEPGGTISSARRGSTPYGAFGQIITGDLNRGMKYEFDRKKSINEKTLQNAIASNDQTKINAAVKKFNNTVTEYETKLNKDVKPGQPKIKLFKVSLNTPEKTIADYSNLSKDYQNAFQKNYKARGYSFKIPSDIKPLSQIAEDVQDPRVMSQIMKRADAGASRVYAEAIPGSRYAAEFLQGFANDITSKKYGKAALKSLGIAGAAYGVYDTGVAFKEGKSAPEMATRFVGLDIPYQKLRQYNRLTDQEQEIQKKINQQKSFDVAADDLLDENLMTMRARPEVSPQEVMQLEQAKQRVDSEVAAEEAERASSRKGLVESLKQKIYDVTGTPYELYMNRGGRVQLAEGGDPKNLGRRKFIKGAATIAVALPFLKFIKPLSKAVEPTIEAVSRSANQMPEYLTNLINKVKMMGESKIIGKMDSPDEFMRYDLGDYELYEGAGGARLKRTRDRGDYGYEEFEMQIKQDPETGYIEYEEVSARPDGDGKIKDFDFGIEDDVHAEMKKFADEK